MERDRLTFDKSGRSCSVGLGSSGDAVVGDPEMRAAINRFNPVAAAMRIFAHGTPESTRIHFYRETGVLWATIQGARHSWVTTCVPDFFTAISRAGFYGMALTRTSVRTRPAAPGQKPDLVKKTSFARRASGTVCRL